MITERQKPTHTITIEVYGTRFTMDILTTVDKLDYYQIIGILERAKYGIVLEEKKVVGDFQITKGEVDEQFGILLPKESVQ